MMVKKRICIIYNFAQKYRKGIYSLLEKEYDCHWVFGENKSDIKGLDYAMFQSVEEIPNQYVIGKWYYQKGILRLFHEYDTFLMLGELFCLSTWLILILHRLLFRKKRIMLWSHGWYGRESRSKKILKNIYFSLADEVLLYGQHAMDVARSFGYRKNNLRIIHNSLDYSSQIRIREGLSSSDIYTRHFGNDNPVIIFIGRLTAIKQLDMLVASLQKMTIRCNLVLVGDGKTRNSLEQQVRELGLEDRVWFYGSCYEEAENAQLLYNADVCVAPGNVGLTAMHSLVYGTPVITHDDFSYQMPEYEAIVEGVTGSFFRYQSVENLATTISHWLKDNKDRREETRHACYKEIDNRWTPEFQMNIFHRVLDK